MNIDRPTLWTLLAETTFAANLAGLMAIGHFLVPDPSITQAAFGLMGAITLSLVWMRRFADLDLRQPRSHEDTRP
ncbi:MAG: hypothetical protein JWM84_2172 [Nocardioides sp.]|nr:hypothetical protein [Nocardioides sp.]